MLGSVGLVHQPAIDLPDNNKQRWRWNAFYHLPVPLDYLEDNSYITIEIVESFNSIKPIVLAHSKFFLEKPILNTEVRDVKLLFGDDECILHSTVAMDMTISCRR
jgi:hypothetical protein